MHDRIFMGQDQGTRRPQQPNHSSRSKQRTLALNRRRVWGVLDQRKHRVASWPTLPRGAQARAIDADLLIERTRCTPVLCRRFPEGDCRLGCCRCTASCTASCAPGAGRCPDDRYSCDQ